VLKGDAVAKKGGKGKWILLLGALAAGAAVMAWRKSNHRPDPWATAGSYTQPKPVTENAGDLAAAAKNKAAEVKDAEVKDAAVEKAGEPTGKASDAAEHISNVKGTDTTATDAIEPRSSGPASDPLAVPAPVILSDAEIDDGAFEDPAAAAEADDDADATLPSISETSEGADLSTPHLDTGSTSTQSSTESSTDRS
jgi:hypothetical protein